MEKSLYQLTTAFGQTSTIRSLLELLCTLLGLSLTVVGLFIAYSEEYLIVYPVLLFVGSLFFVKIFVLFHDCVHGSMFSNVVFNTWVGRFLSVFIVTPFTQWKLEHLDHHSHVSDIDRIRYGDVPLLTVEQYQAASLWKRVGYRVFRHPLFLIFAAPFLYFFIKGRLPNTALGKACVVSVLTTNVVLALVYLPLFYVIGFWTMVAVYILPAYIGGIIGITLFYLQHDYPEAQWYTTKDWDPEIAAMKGSSCLRLPQPFEWFSHSIGYHHIHHLNSTIPGYRLKACFQSNPALQEVSLLSAQAVIQSFSLKLWSSKKRRLITFDEL